MNNDNNGNKPRVSHIGYMQIKLVPNEELEIGEDYYFFYSGNFYLGKLDAIIYDSIYDENSYEFTATKKYALKYPDNGDEVVTSNVDLVLTTKYIPYEKNTTEGGRRKTRKQKLNKRKTIKLKKHKSRKTNKKSSRK